MSEKSPALHAIEPELLLATFGPGGRVGQMNPAWRAYFGSETDPWARLSAEDRQHVLQFLKESAGGVLVTNQMAMIDVPDRDEPLPILLNFLPVCLPGEPGTPEVRAVSVTGEVLAEPATWTESQTQRHRMESLGRMTMGIAHDFNNLLSGILGYTELVQTELASEPSSPTLLAHLRTIEQAALDGAALVRKIQQYIRQEKQVRFEPVNVNSLIEDCVAFTRPYWYNEPRRQGISIEVAQDFAPHAIARGSASELREVFINLILNAVQAMPEGGAITFRTVSAPSQDVTVTVSDTGSGMSQHVVERIFEPLFTTKGKHGTGMGLSVSYGIIQEHEGSISVESAPNSGTTFQVTLPSADDPEPDDLIETDAGPQQPARILVVDDERMVRSVLQRLLTLKGHDVQVVGSGAEALVLTESEHFDLVFTDHGMPEMNGRQLARALRRRLPNLPIVLLTGDTEVGQADENIDVVLAKPFKIGDLAATIQDLVHQRTKIED